MERGIQVESVVRRKWATLWSDGDISKAPQIQLLHKNLAIGLYTDGRKEEALVELDALLERSPYSSELRELRARMLYEMERFTESVDELMLLSVIVSDSALYVNDLATGLKRVFPESRPVVQDSAGRRKLDLSDSAVKQTLQAACHRYKSLLERDARNKVSIARFERTARYIYGFEL